MRTAAASILHKAERLIESCEHCNEDDAQIPFDNILDRVTGSDPSVTDYILESPAKCPNCRREINCKSQQILKFFRGEFGFDCRNNARTVDNLYTVPSARMVSDGRLSLRSGP